MEDKPQNVFQELKELKNSVSSVSDQNEQIIGLLLNIAKSNNLSNTPNQTNNVKPAKSNQQILKEFVRNSKKEHVWLGPKEEFEKSKLKVIVICVSLIIIGILSTILTSVACHFYTGIIENIWTIFVIVLLVYASSLKKRMIDVELRDHSNTIFVQDADGTWRDTNKEKKGFRWFRRLSYFSVGVNLVLIWNLRESTIGISVFATITEILFVGLSIYLFFAVVDLYCMYGTFIIFTGKREVDNKEISLVFDTIKGVLTPYEEYDGKIKEMM